ncbi:MAG: PIN domain-containing protein [Verrucomicrobiales bacterium]|nr:PIN domain-containing protein [Verrucomicrobiales bacterium]
MSRPLLVDSSWYITKARQGIDPLEVLSCFAESRDIAVCGLIKMEVGRGIRSQKLLERYEAAWDIMLYIEDGYRRWEDTLALAWSLDRKGIILPVQDVHIAACALHAGAVILTYDQHFRLIPGVDATDAVY